MLVAASVANMIDRKVGDPTARLRKTAPRWASSRGTAHLVSAATKMSGVITPGRAGSGRGSRRAVHERKTPLPGR